MRLGPERMTYQIVFHFKSEILILFVAVHSGNQSEFVYHLKNRFLVWDGYGVLKISRSHL